MTRAEAATLHLHLWLTSLHRTLAAACTGRTASTARAIGTPAPPGALSPDHVAELLASMARTLADGRPALPPVALTAREVEAEAGLLADAPVLPPLRVLADRAGLDAFDRTALLVTIAPDVLPEARALYGYLLDDMARTVPSVELVLALTDNGRPADLGARRAALGPGGRLRRLGLVVADDPLATTSTTCLTPAHGLLEWLLGASPAPPVPLREPRMIRPASGASPAAWLAPAVRCLREAANGAAGLWGPDPNRHDDTVAALGRGLGRPVLRVAARGDTFERWWSDLALDAAVARGADAILWIETPTLPGGRDGERAAEALSSLPQHIVLTGREPWRPVAFVGQRPYADVTIVAPPASDDWGLPPDLLPVETGRVLAARYRLGLRARCAARQAALSDVRNRANGTAPDLGEALARAARMMATPAQLPSLRIVEPRRTLDDLILPAGHHAQIAEMAALVGHAATVDDGWGFGRLTGSSGALKALFTGDPGTGKTLAAEVAAGGAGVALMKVDLSQVVSKWVGETEKNLEAVFDHAEQSRAALFFDEADALFGKRGEVRHGTDRYANLEVSYLLQRLESYCGGLLILASNMRDEIDPAFSRRFQIALHFPRPGRAERLRIWETAFARAPLAPGLLLDAAAEHDLTGGGIVSAARMAALLAAGEGAERIAQRHIDTATERQFRKEARLMSQRRPDGLSVARARA